MATITLEYDARNKGTVSILQGLLNVGLFKVKAKKETKNGILAAMEDVKRGRVYKAKSAADMINTILK